jgi:hypothetical protein
MKFVSIHIRTTRGEEVKGKRKAGYVSYLNPWQIMREIREVPKWQK